MRTISLIAKTARIGFGLAALFGLAACYLDDGPADYGDAAYGSPYADGADVVIQNDGDFYGPLSAYGTWETVGAYGQCWVPGGVGPDWQPYENGTWVSTDAGWYWESDEPWGWATYHYGRWFNDPGVGWCWRPGTQWAPAWVSWCDDGDDIGWAPLAPDRGGFWSRWRGRREDPRHFVFVPRRDFQRHLRPADEDRFRASVIARAGPALDLQVRSAGPSRTVIAQASGRPVRTVAARDERRRTDAVVVSHWRRPATAAPTVVNPMPAPVAPAASAPAAPRRAEPRRERRSEGAPPARMAAPPPRAEALPRPAPAGVAPLREPSVARPAPPAVRPVPSPAARPVPPPAAHRPPPPRRDKREDQP